jgi:hypothetical protein
VSARREKICERSPNKSSRKISSIFRLFPLLPARETVFKRSVRTVNLSKKMVSAPGTSRIDALQRILLRLPHLVVAKARELFEYRKTAMIERTSA